MESKRGRRSSRVFLLSWLGLTQGLSRPAALDCAGISSGTWRNWQDWRQAGEPRLPARGRPPRCASPSERKAAIDFLKEHGDQVPLRALCEHVPTVPQAELADLRGRYQRVVRYRRERFLGRLLWKRVGAVWAMDFTEPNEYIGGTDGWILAIRDLTSGYQLAWLSCAEATAECVVGVLKGLFTEHGPPLVLKSDNGSQFIAEATLELLREWRVEPLFNPPRRPAYNGGLERTHPILKSYTLAAAATQGRPAGILPEDLQTGRANANRFTRRLGRDGPTAEEAWRTREPLTEELRVALQRSVEDRRPTACASRGLLEDVELNHHQRAAVDREAIRDALLAHDLLEILPYGKRAQPTNAAFSPASSLRASQPPASLSTEPPVAERAPEPVLPEPVLPEPVLPEPVLPVPVLQSPERPMSGQGQSSGLPVMLVALHLCTAACSSVSGGKARAAAELAPVASSASSVSDRPPDFEKSEVSAAPLALASCRIIRTPETRPVTDGRLSGVGTTHGEPTPFNIPRRLIAPLINWLRRVKFR